MVVLTTVLLGACGSPDPEATPATTRDTRPVGAALRAIPARASAATDSAGTYIVGGRPVDVATLPWTASIGYKTDSDDRVNHFCGGVLLTPTVVLSAAHCMFVTEDGKRRRERARDLHVVLGRSALNETGGEVHDVSRLRVNRLFKESHYRWDYAVATLATPSRQTPVRLPTRDSTTLWDGGSPLLAVGWGCTKARTPRDDDETCSNRPPLQGTTVFVQGDAVCNQEPGYFPRTMRCGRDPASRSVTCFGDSGGPLVSKADDGDWYLVGLVSWAHGSVCDPGSNDYYAFVPGAYDWIGVR
jgi:secreted trypsin-like serine protease